METPCKSFSTIWNGGIIKIALEAIIDCSDKL
jgi:hypothetical protein